jgi:GT2 family glycosyltransferase
MVLPKVSIIVVNYNGKQLLEKCFESLFKINYDNFEVILVDNNSTDNTIEFVRKNYPSVIIIKLDSNKGFAEPNNIAAKTAKGEYILFLNNDTIVTKNFITKMIKEIEKDETIAICQSLLLKLDGSVDSSGDFIDKLGIVYNSKSLINDVREISSARGASMLIRKNIFHQLGGFDEKFFVSFEDVDLGWRTWILGYRVIIVPESIVYHLGGTTIKKIKLDIAFHGFKNQLSMKITNFEILVSIKALTKFLIIYGIRETKIWFDYALYGVTKLSSTKYEENTAQKPSLKIIFKSFFWILCNQKYLWRKHKCVNSMRRLNTKQLRRMRIICD